MQHYSDILFLQRKIHLEKSVRLVVRQVIIKADISHQGGASTLPLRTTFFINMYKCVRVQVSKVLFLLLSFFFNLSLPACIIHVLFAEHPKCFRFISLQGSSFFNFILYTMKTPSKFVRTIVAFRCLSRIIILFTLSPFFVFIESMKTWHYKDDLKIEFTILLLSSFCNSFIKLT